MYSQDGYHRRNIMVVDKSLKTWNHFIRPNIFSVECNMTSVQLNIAIELLLPLVLQLCDCIPVLEPPNGVFKTVAEKSITPAEGIQYFFVNYNRKLPQLDKILLQQAVEAEAQLETAGYNQFNVFDYAFKHQQTTVIFIIVHHYSRNQNIIDTWEPFVHNGTERWIDKRRDVVLHIYDVTMPWKGYRKPHPDRRCIFSYNVILLEFSAQKTLMLSPKALQLNCPRKNPCLEPLQEWEDNDGAMSYVSIKQLLKLRRRKLFNIPVALKEFSGDPTIVEGPKGVYVMSNQLRAGVGDKSEEAEIIQTMPFIDLSMVLNFTILIQTSDGWTNGIRHYDHTCANGIFSKEKQTVTRKYALVSTPSQYYHDLMAYVLIYGAADELYVPTTFSSVLGPFPWEIWVLAAVGSGIAAIYAASQSEWKDVGATVIAVWAPLLNQSPMNGIAKTTFIWHSAWIFAMVYINTCYLGFLASLEMVPGVRTVNGSFKDLEKQNFSFFSTMTDRIDLTFDFYAIKTRQEMGQDFMGVNDFDKDVIADFLKLKKLLHDEPLDDMEPEEAKKFLRLQSKAWMARDFDGEALKKVGQKVLKCSYNQLQASFLSMPTFVQIEVVYGEIVSLYYSYLVDTGLVSLWKSLYHRSVSIFHEERYLTALGVNGTDTGNNVDVAPVVIHDSLILESACLYGIGLALAFFINAVMMCFRCWGERMRNMRKHRSTKKHPCLTK